MRRLIVGITGATGAILGVRLLEALKDSEVESHLVMSNWARRTIEHETQYTIKQVSALASVYHNSADMAAEISSGSFVTEGMVVGLSGIAAGLLGCPVVVLYAVVRHSVLDANAR